MRLLGTDPVTECLQLLRRQQAVTRDVPEIQTHHPFHENRVESWSPVESDDSGVWCCSSDDSFPWMDCEGVLTPVGRSASAFSRFCG